MTSAVTAVFYLHTVLCAAYAAYLVHLMARGAGRRLALSGQEEAEGAPDETVVLVAGHGSLLLYLLYAEAYLYRSFQILR
jgi:hypothetical protein